MFTGAFTPILALLAAAAVCVRADPNPTSPGPGDVFVQGSSCTIKWDADPTGVWKNMNIDLMTGDNFNMISLTSVATNIDGTSPSKNSFSYTCPQVSPYSPIYFYQFSSASSTNKTWTGRFTITDSANDVVAPSQSTQPDGQKIAWGTGALVNGSAPAASGANSTSTTTSSTSSTTSTSSTFSETPTSTVNPVTSDVPTPTAATGTNDAVAMYPGSVSNVLFQIGLGLGAFGFTVLF